LETIQAFLGRNFWVNAPGSVGEPLGSREAGELSGRAIGSVEPAGIRLAMVTLLKPVRGK